MKLFRVKLAQFDGDEEAGFDYEEVVAESPEGVREIIYKTADRIYHISEILPEEMNDEQAKRLRDAEWNKFESNIPIIKIA